MVRFDCPDHRSLRARRHPARGIRPAGLAVTGLLAASLLTAGVGPAAAQTLFGQNKIQYSDFQWQVMKTPHIDLHFYPEEREVARWVAEVGEEAASEFESAMGIELHKPIPFMLYASPHAFQQTNVSPYLISESVGGLTELIKGRVLVPHNGSYYKLRWVVRHELVHAIMLEKISQVLREHKKTRYTYPPLWYVEGLAEFLSSEWDARADMVLRDAVINERLVPIPEMWRINGTYQMYKQGQSVLLYIEREYGRDKVLEFLDAWWQRKTFDDLVEEILGVTIDDLNEAWTDDLKRRYFPQVGERDSIELAGAPVVERGRFNLKPFPLPPRPGAAVTDTTPDAAANPDMASPPADTTGLVSCELVYMSSYEDFTNIRLASFDPRVKPHDGPEPELLIKGGTTETFESLHFFQTALDVNAARELVLVAKQGERDVLHLFDIDARELRATLEFPDLVGLQSPAWSPDGRRIAFSGVDVAGQRDIYTVDRTGSDLVRLTSDHFDDLDPDWSPDGRLIVFASDRCPGGADGSYNLYLHDLETRTTTALTSGPHQDATPAWSPDGRLVAFGSDRDGGILDLWVTDLQGNARTLVQRQTAVMDPEWTSDGRAVLVTSFIDGSFGAFQVPVDPDTLPPADRVPPVPDLLVSRDPEQVATDETGGRGSNWEPETPDTTYAIDRYRRRFGLDLVTGGVAYDPEFGGSAGGGQIALSDMLGNERLYFFIANDGGDSGGGSSFLGSFDVGATYFNLTRRLNWGIGAFRLTRTYNADLDVFRREARVGGMFIARYPISRFDRIETSLVARRITDHLYRSFIEEDTYFISNFFSYVHDSTLWNILGPFNGSRYNVTVGLTTDVGEGIGDYTSVLVDYRRYHRLTTKMTHAVRLAGSFSFGDEGQVYSIGGAHSLRGYPRRSVLGQRIVVFNNEIRLPFVERMVLRLPMGLVDLPILHSAAFFDVAWSDDRYYASDTYGSFGLGLYVGGGPFPRLRVDFAWRTDFESVAPTADTEFSIGFNY